MTPCRLLVFTESAGRGGAEVSLRNLLAELDPAIDARLMGVDAEICSWIASARPGTEVTLVRPVQNKTSIRALWALRREIARVGPDVFHANLRTITDAQYALVAALAVRGLRVIAVEQLPYAPTTLASAWLKRRTSARLDAHVAVGRRAARLVEQTAGLPHNSVITIYNGVPDLGPAAPKPVGRRVVIGTLARLEAVKGLDVLLDAVHGLPTSELLLVGNGMAKGALAAQARRLGIDERVRFRPWSDDARAALQEMDIFVLPSRNEGFPLAIVEAMLAGLPVVATDVGSVREAVEDDRTGFLVSVDDTVALREALRRLVGCGDLRRRMGEAGRDRAVQAFTADRMARAFEDLYGRVLSAGQR